MKKSPCSLTLAPDLSIRELLFIHPHLMPMIQALGLHGPYGESSIRQVCKDQNILEPVLVSLLEAGIYSDFELRETLPSYGLLQLCELVRNLMDYLREQLQLLQSLKFDSEIVSQANLLQTFHQDLERSVDLLKQHRFELEDLVLPHIAAIYELYYSPEYTSAHSNLLIYSMEFFPKNALPHAALETMENVFEKVEGDSLEHWRTLQDFHQLISLTAALERVENKLLKPVILQMEDAIIKTFQKKRFQPMRMAFLALPETKHQPILLSKREQEVLSLVAQGLMNKEIADRLSISLTTVITHRKNIVGKLGIHTLAGLTVYAFTHGYLNENILINED